MFSTLLKQTFLNVCVSVNAELRRICVNLPLFSKLHAVCLVTHQNLINFQAPVAQNSQNLYTKETHFAARSFLLGNM
jgi:hypothetical protein